ncbi:MAG: hypothetical protein ACE5EC_08575 [Phycisphaerae bacterium]
MRDATVGIEKGFSIQRDGAGRIEKGFSIQRDGAGRIEKGFSIQRSRALEQWGFLLNTGVPSSVRLDARNPSAIKSLGGRAFSWSA